jgi:hypothetical protein
MQKKKQMYINVFPATMICEIGSRQFSGGQFEIVTLTEIKDATAHMLVNKPVLIENMIYDPGQIT